MGIRPMRIFEGTARPHEPFWRLRDAAESESGVAEMELYGYISEYSWFDDDVTPRMFKDDLYKLGKGGPIKVRLNSGGGDVIAASVIKATLLDYPGDVTIQVDGLAASAATIVLMGGDKVQMIDSAYLMIHDPITVAVGNIEELKTAIDMLKQIKAGIVDGYAAKTKLPEEKLAKMMADETWMSAEDAFYLGFVDDVIKTSEKKRSSLKSMAVLNALTNYRNVPEELKGRLSLEEEPVVQTPVQEGEQKSEAAAKRLRAEAKILRKGERK